MTSRDSNGGPTEEQVRALVSQIVDGVLPESAGEQVEPEHVPSMDPLDSSSGEGHIAIGADHGGYPLKERLAVRLREAGWEVVDCGTDSHEAVDYPDFAKSVAEKVASGECQWGLMIDGAGIGSAMAANKVPGVRASMCYDISTARNAREHNHANVLTLGAGSVRARVAQSRSQETKQQAGSTMQTASQQSR